MDSLSRRSFVKAGSIFGGALAGSAQAAAGSGAGLEEIAIRAGSLTAWESINPSLAVGEPAVAWRKDAGSILKVGDGRPWRETPPLSEPFSFQSLAEVVATDWLRPGDVVTVYGRRAAGDGGAALWRIVADEPTDGACRLALDNRLVARLVHQTHHDVRQAGIFADTPGADVARAIRALARHVIEGGGGVIEIGQRILCGNVVFPPIPPRAAITFAMLPGAHVKPSDPKPGVFLWDFPTGDLPVTAPNFRNLRVWGSKIARPRCNGVRVGPTNYMTIENCSGHFLDGCAWQIETANNARIDITTFNCGTSDGVYAQNFTAHVETGKPCNDLVLQGTTEQDRHGINIEAAAIVRDGSSLKLHGGPATQRALRLHRCVSFALRVYASHRWNREGFILVSDAANSGGESLAVAVLDAFENTRGTLEIDTMYNIRWGGVGSAAWCVLDLQSPSSFVTLNGHVNVQAAPVRPGADYHHFRIAGPGNWGVTYGLDGLRFASIVEPERRLRDERSDETERRNRPLLATSRPDPAPLTEVDLVDGQFDLRGADFVDIRLADPATATGFLMDLGRECTICTPTGRLTVRHSPVLRLSGSADFVMGRYATLTLRRVASDRFHEIARCAP